MLQLLSLFALASIGLVHTAYSQDQPITQLFEWRSALVYSHRKKILY